MTSDSRAVTTPPGSLLEALRRWWRVRRWKPSEAALDEWGSDAAAFQNWYVRYGPRYLTETSDDA